jgi:hypothetical protein
MTKERVAFSLSAVVCDEEQQVPPLRFAPVGMTILPGKNFDGEGYGL